MKIHNGTEPFEIDSKRCYVPATITDTCPSCGAEVTWSGDHGDYLSFPTANEPTELHLYHGDCPAHGGGTEWSVRVVLRMILEQVP